MDELDRSSLPERLAKALAEKIHCAVWKDHLPGYRVLAAQFGVSRPTCEDAFNILELQGLLGPAEPRKPRRIIAPLTEDARIANRRLLVISDRMNPIPPDDEKMIDLITGFWKSEGGQISRTEADLSRTRRPDSILGRWLKEIGADCILLYMPPKPWILAAERCGLPCYAVGGEKGDGEKRMSGNGWAADLFLLPILKACYTAGHRRVLFPCAGVDDLPYVRAAIERALKETAKRNPQHVMPIVSTEGPRTSDPAAWRAWWPKVLMNDKPTLVILGQVRECVGFHNFCHCNGIRIPADLSLIVMADDPVLAWLDPEPTRYRYPMKKALRHFQRWVRCGSPVGDFRFFDLDLIEGKTFAPAPNRVSQ